MDVYQYPVDGSTPKGSILRLPEYLHYYFTDLGYKTIAFYDSMQGFYNSCEDGHIESFADLTKAKLEGRSIRSDFKGKANSATSLVRAAVSQNKQPVAIVMNLASRYITSPDNIDQSEVDSFTNLLLASMEGKDVRTENGTLKNLVVMVVNKVNDVPAWFYLANPNVKTVSIGTPSKEEREQLIKGDNFPSFFAADGLLGHQYGICRADNTVARRDAVCTLPHSHGVVDHISGADNLVITFIFAGIVFSFDFRAWFYAITHRDG